MGRAAGVWRHRRWMKVMEVPDAPVDDLSRSLVAFDQDAALIVVVEMSEASWLVAGMAPGVDRQPLKNLGLIRMRCCDG